MFHRCFGSIPIEALKNAQVPDALSDVLVSGGFTRRFLNAPTRVCRGIEFRPFVMKQPDGKIKVRRKKSYSKLLLQRVSKSEVSKLHSSERRRIDRNFSKPRCVRVAVQTKFASKIRLINVKILGTVPSFFWHSANCCVAERIFRELKKSGSSRNFR